MGYSAQFIVYKPKTIMSVVLLLIACSVLTSVFGETKITFEVVYSKNDFEEELFGTGDFRKSVEVRRFFLINTRSVSRG